MTAKIPIPAGTRSGADITSATGPAVEVVRNRPVESGKPFDEPARWKRPCLADHQARSGHSCHEAPRATDLQLPADGLPSYADSRLRPIARSLPSNASTAFHQAPSPAHSGGGPVPTSARTGTRSLTTGTTTRTCADTITSEIFWRGRSGLFGPGSGENCGVNSDLLMIESLPAQPTTCSPRRISLGGDGESRSDSLGDLRHTKGCGMQHQRQRMWRTPREASRNSMATRSQQHTAFTKRSRLFATDAILNGMPPHIAQLILGHDDVNTTMGYKNHQEFHQTGEKPQVSWSRDRQNSVPLVPMPAL